MDKIELCHICGNNHLGTCSSELTYFYWHTDKSESPPTNVEIVGEWYRWQNHEKMTREVDEEGLVYF